MGTLEGLALKEDRSVICTIYMSVTPNWSWRSWRNKEVMELLDTFVKRLNMKAYFAKTTYNKVSMIYACPTRTFLKGKQAKIWKAYSQGTQALTNTITKDIILAGMSSFQRISMLHPRSWQMTSFQKFEMIKRNLMNLSEAKEKISLKKCPGSTVEVSPIKCFPWREAKKGMK